MNDDKEKNERIAKRIARAGICSRRDAEKLIVDGLVKLNGKIVETPATKVCGKDKIHVNGKLIAKKEPTRLWMYHKRKGLVTTHKDESNRETVFQHLPKNLPRVISVGRLDLNSEGLLLLTNDGELSRYLEMPSSGLTRSYRVRAHGRITQTKLDRLKDGITIDGITYGAIDAYLESSKGSNSWINFSLTEGKNREIRKVLEHLGMSVNRLIRTTYGKFELGTLKHGEVEEVPQEVLEYFFKSKF